MPYQLIKPSRTRNDRRKSQGRHGCGEGDHQSGKVDLADQVPVVYEARAAPAKGLRKIGPGYQGGIRENGIRQIVGRNPGKDTEDDRKNNHRQQRLKNRPGRADYGLLVTDFHIPPDKKVKELSVLPEIA